MAKVIIPEGYNPILSVKETEQGIRRFKNFFQSALSTELNLMRVTAPLFVLAGTGINDDLNGVEAPVSFVTKEFGKDKLEVVQSLAKWKRLKVTAMGLESGFGIYSDMNAVRPDEELDNIHSLYVDQWDWELAINETDRNLEYLKKVVSSIYGCLKRAEFFVYDNYPAIKPILPKEITFIHSEELLERYPDKDSKERERLITEECGAVFIIGIGADLKNGKPHDGRAPDYDDWVTETGNNKKGLNGDIILWNPILKQPLEISSMGIRVSKDSLQKQLETRNCPERSNLYFHSRLLNGELHQTMGGGIGQSRMCQFFLRKAHIGEVHASIWPDEMCKTCADNNIYLL